MLPTKFSKNVKRRLNSKAGNLRFVLTRNEALFVAKWNNLVKGWIGEIRFRARSWAAANEAENKIFLDRKGLPEGTSDSIFGVVEIADYLLHRCGGRAEELVGHETRATLEGECVRAVARVCDPRLDGSLVQHRLYRSRL